MDGIAGVGNANGVHPLQGLTSANAPTANEEDEFFESDEFLEIVVTIGVTQLLFQYTMARILEISTTDVLIEAMDLHK